MSNALPELVKTLREFEDGMLVTKQPSGLPRGRPMQIAEVDEDGSVWFLVKEKTRAVEALEHDPHVAVICQRPDVFVSISGIAEVFQFPSKLRMVWKASFDRWFPEGPDSTEAVAIRVAPVQGDRWDKQGAHLSLEERIS